MWRVRTHRRAEATLMPQHIASRIPYCARQPALRACPGCPRVRAVKKVIRPHARGKAHARLRALRVCKPSSAARFWQALQGRIKYRLWSSHRLGTPYWRERTHPG
jgi:hypothetical protein